MFREKVYSGPDACLNCGGWGYVFGGSEPIGSSGTLCGCMGTGRRFLAEPEAVVLEHPSYAYVRHLMAFLESEFIELRYVEYLSDDTYSVDFEHPQGLLFVLEGKGDDAGMIYCVQPSHMIGYRKLTYGNAFDYLVGLGVTRVTQVDKVNHEAALSRIRELQALARGLPREISAVEYDTGEG